MSTEWIHTRGGRFLKAQAIVLVPLGLWMLPIEEGPFVLVKLALLVPCILLITLPAILFSIAGVPWYEFREFGAMPQNTAAWVLIFVFWSLAAFLWCRWKDRHVDMQSDEAVAPPE